MWKKLQFCDECEPMAMISGPMDNSPKMLITSFDQNSVNAYIAQLEYISQSHPASQAILVEIDSFGGEAYGLIKLIEAFNTVQNRIITYCRSKAMSAGAVLFAVIASKGLRFATPEARFMVHEAQSGYTPGGDIKDMQVYQKEMERLNDTIMIMLAKSIGLESRKDIKELIRKIVDGNELYLNAQEAKNLNLVDHVEYVRMFPVSEFVVQTNANSRLTIEAETEKMEEEREVVKEKPLKRNKKK